MPAVKAGLSCPAVFWRHFPRRIDSAIAAEHHGSISSISRCFRPSDANEVAHVTEKYGKINLHRHIQRKAPELSLYRKRSCLPRSRTQLPASSRMSCAETPQSASSKKKESRSRTDASHTRLRTRSCACVKTRLIGNGRCICLTRNNRYA